MPGYGQQSMYAYGQEMPSHRGKGPKGYTRSDERIREHVCEVLSDDHHVDAVTSTSRSRTARSP